MLEEEKLYAGNGINYNKWAKLLWLPLRFVWGFFFFFDNISTEIVSLSCVRLLRSHGLQSSWNSPAQKTRVGTLSLLQGIFPTQGSNPDFPYCMQIPYQLSQKGSPWRYNYWDIICMPHNSPISSANQWFLVHQKNCSIITRNFTICSTSSKEHL